MNNHTKKKIYLIIISVVVCTSVYLLFPLGNQFLLFVRQQPSTETQYGKEIIYTYIDKGDVQVADNILQNKYAVSRFEAVEIDSINWNEDPYSDIYWRFNFYNLEPVRNLLYAWETTGDPIYKDKLVEITTSFIDTGMESPYAWDLHGTAFRTMTLVNVWVSLREKNELPIELNHKILHALSIHGDFLADPEHFEREYNHGLDQSAALYLLATNFPQLQMMPPQEENYETWLAISTERIQESINTIIDKDGVLVENSPYYHFYVLDKLWEIKNYQTKNDLPIISELDVIIDKMVAYGTNVLQPNLMIPTVGASLGEQKRLSGVYKEIAQLYPEMLYVLTRGEQGKKPIALNKHYPIAGQTIMRSGWKSGEKFTDQTQIIFDVGKYRTNHSDLDALSFNLYSKGLALLPDSGLYTYDVGPYRTYFHGTRSHNTVVVDGMDQSAGENITDSTTGVYTGRFEKGEGYVYQSGQHSLYAGVSHERALAMIEDSTILIFDRLGSSEEHTYEQMFHLFPGAEISTDGLTLVAKGDRTEQTLTIQQLLSNETELHTTIDQQDPIDGVCSTEYKTAVPCYSVSYSQKGSDISYITMLSIGKNPATATVDKENGLVTIKTKNNTYTIQVDRTEEKQENIIVKKNFDLESIYSDAQPEHVLNSPLHWYNPANKSLSAYFSGSAVYNYNTRALEITTGTDGRYLETTKPVALNLSKHNLYLKVKVDQTSNLNGIDLYLSNDNWQKSARFNLESSVYDVDRNGEWLQFNVNRSNLRKGKLGGWVINDPTFNWSQIDSIKFVVGSELGTSVKVSVRDFRLIPEQKEARAVIIFDDGWSSVLETLPLMNKYGYKGNVSAITDSVGSKRYLSLRELQMLQNEYGWNIVNHTSLHKDVIADYEAYDNLEGYHDDVTNALRYLIKNDINSAPNWFVYPNGKTSSDAKNVVQQYYKFARATVDAPESFPYADPLEVRVFSAYEDRASIADIENAVQDAVNYNQTIMLMFHRFTVDTPSVYTEWQVSAFEEVLQILQNQGIKVVTLSELDDENNIPLTEFEVHDYAPQQTNLIISVSDNRDNPFKKIINWFAK